jgi:hypothetical protein
VRRARLPQTHRPRRGRSRKNGSQASLVDAGRAMDAGRLGMAGKSCIGAAGRVRERAAQRGAHSGAPETEAGAAAGFRSERLADVGTSGARRLRNAPRLRENGLFVNPGRGRGLHKGCGRQEIWRPRNGPLARSRYFFFALGESKPPPGLKMSEAFAFASD